MVQNVSFGSSSSSGISSSSSDKLPPELEGKIPSEIASKGKDAVIEYCKENNITIPEPPEKSSTSGSVFDQSKTSSSNKVSSADEDPSDEFKAELMSLGVPAATISQGREAVMAYCKQNNITLPEPPDNGSSGFASNSSLDFSA